MVSLNWLSFRVLPIFLYCPAVQKAIGPLAIRWLTTLECHDDFLGQGAEVGNLTFAGREEGEEGGASRDKLPASVVKLTWVTVGSRVGAWCQ